MVFVKKMFSIKMILKGQILSLDRENIAFKHLIEGNGYLINQAWENYADKYS